MESILDPTGIIIPNTIFGYDLGYYLPENIEPGKAYWLRSSGEGNIIFSSTVQFTTKMAVVEQVEANTIIMGGQTGFDTSYYCNIQINIQINFLFMLNYARKIRFTSSIISKIFILPSEFRSPR